MKNYFSILFILIFPLLTFSQAKISKDFSFDVSKPYRVIDADEKHYFHKNGEIMAVKVDNFDVYIQKFNADNLTEISRTHYKRELSPTAKFETILQTNNRFYLLFREGPRPNRKALFYKEIDFETGKLSKNKTLLVKPERDETAAMVEINGVRFRRTSYHYNLNVSEDGSKILVQYRLEPKFKKNSKNFDEIGICVFDSDLNLLWKDIVKMPYTEKQMDILDYFVDSKGVLYILNRIYEGSPSAFSWGEPAPSKFHIELFRLTESSEKIDISKIYLKDKFINSIQLEESNGKIIGAGFYNQGDNFHAVDGVFYFSINGEGLVENEKSHEIPGEILTQYSRKSAKARIERKDKKGKAEFQYLSFKHIIPKEDGSVLLIGEQYFKVVSSSNSGNGNYSQSVTYHYNDILVTKLDSNGSLSWMKKLPKRQEGGSGQGGMSYTVVEDKSNNNVYLLFLDNVKNLVLPIDKRPNMHRDGKGGFYTGYKINSETGNTSKMSIFDTRNINGIAVYQFNTSRVLGLTNSTFVVELYKKQKEDVLVKIYLKN